MVKRIDRFAGEHFFLSNFYPVSFLYRKLLYKSSEHAYQAAKAMITLERDWIREALTARTAKRRGRKVTLRVDWDEVKTFVMERILEDKFVVPHLRTMLLRTDDAILIEGNYWGDTFWGICNGEGTNHLGKILMRLRARIREGYPNETHYG